MFYCSNCLTLKLCIKTIKSVLVLEHEAWADGWSRPIALWHSGLICCFGNRVRPLHAKTHMQIIGNRLVFQFPLVAIEKVKGVHPQTSKPQCHLYLKQHSCAALKLMSVPKATLVHWLLTREQLIDLQGNTGSVMTFSWMWEVMGDLGVVSHVHTS